MISRPGAATASEGILRRWQTWLETLPTPSSIERLVGGFERSEPDPGDGPVEVYVHEVFVRVPPAERRSVDLLLVAHVWDHNDPEQSETMVIGSEEFHARARTDGMPGGVTFGEIPIHRLTAGRQMSVALVRIDRESRSREVAASIAGLGRVLARSSNAADRSAITRAIVRRLGVLTTGPGVAVPVWGTIGRLRELDRQDRAYLLTNAPLKLDDEVERRRDGLVISSPVIDPNRSVNAMGTPSPVTAPESASPPSEPESVISPSTPESLTSPVASRPTARERRPWQDGDYVLVRVGRVNAALGEAAASLIERRDSYFLNADPVEASTAAGDFDSYSARATAVRQRARAQKVRDLLATGDRDTAARQLSVGLSQPGARGPLADALAGQVDRVAHFWGLRDVALAALPLVDDAAARLNSNAGAQEITSVLLGRLGDRLDALLRLDREHDEVTEDSIPVVTPIVLEVGDALIPLVDNRVDDGLFLFTLVPEMRERITASTGLVVPGVRARGNPNLGPGGFAIQINEITRIQADMPATGYFTARAVDQDPATESDEIAEVHPVSSSPGRWIIEHHDGDPPTPDLVQTVEPAPDAPFTPAMYLAHRIERVIRAHLSLLVGVQEVSALVADWRDQDQSVTRVINDTVDEHRLTVLLQRLVAERVPITDWQAILAAVADEGGLSTDLRALHRAVRQRLRAALPGPSAGPLLIPVPDSYQQALLRQPAAEQSPADREAATLARVDFLGWLRHTIEQHGSVVSLVTADQASRERIAALAAAERAVITTYAQAELVDP